MRDVLITGGSGFIGRALAERLASDGGKVAATTTSIAAAPASPGVHWVEWDAGREPLPEVDWQRFGAIVHLAAPRGVFAFPERAAPLYATTVEATFRLLEKAREAGVSRFLLGSTGDVLGPSSGPASEDDPSYRPSSFYGATKACAELLTAGYSQTLSTAVLRFYHPYGTGGGRFLINRLFAAVRSGSEIRIEGEHGIVLNPVWIDDAVEGIRLALESPANGVFHLAGPEQCSLLELVTRMGEILEAAPVVRHVGERPSSPHAASYSHSRDLLGYAPAVGLDEGLRRLLREGD